MVSQQRDNRRQIRCLNPTNGELSHGNELYNISFLALTNRGTSTQLHQNFTGQSAISCETELIGPAPLLALHSTEYSTKIDKQIQSE